MLCIAGFDGYFKDLNPSWERTLGFTIEELTAKPFIEFVHPDDRAATIAEAQRAMSADVVSFQNRYLCKDGSYKWLLWSARASPERRLYYSVARDITEYKRAQEAVRASEEKFRAVAETAPDAIVSADARGTITYFNGGAERIFGYRAPDVIGKPLALLIPDRFHDAQRQAYSRFLSTGDPRIIGRMVELVGRKKDGSEFPVELSQAVWRSGGETFFTGILRDISERRRAEEGIRRAKEEAERATQAKSDFLSRMSHELRTPLNAVIGFSDLLLERIAGEITAKQEEFLRDIRNSGAHLLALINDILDISKIEAGRMQLQFTDTDLTEVVTDALTTLQPLSAQKGLDVSSVLDPGVVTVRADRVRLRQILYNLLSNAAKFTPPGGRIRVEAHRVNDEVEIAVVDTGPGISPDDLGKLFQEFSQLRGGEQSGHVGTGLGLALVKRLVELHGGRVRVESEVGKGSRFLIRLSLAAGTETAPTGPGAVLIVEHDPAVRKLFAHYLAEAGYHTDVIADGQGVVDRAKAVHPSAICLDIRLSGVEDWEVLRRLKEDPATASIPVVVVTILEDAERAFSLGATDVLRKPISRETLLDAVSKALRTPPQVTPTVLIVDDDVSVLAAIPPMLEQAGYRTLTASGGREGITQAKQHLPHLIVLDLLMPEVNGFEVIVALRGDVRTQGIPILILTAKDLTPEDRVFLTPRVQRIELKESTLPAALLKEVTRVLASAKGDGG